MNRSDNMISSGNASVSDQSTRQFNSHRNASSYNPFSNNTINTYINDNTNTHNTIFNQNNAFTAVSRQLGKLYNFVIY